MKNVLRDVCSEYIEFAGYPRDGVFLTGFKKLDERLHLAKHDSVLITSKYRGYAVDLPIKMAKGFSEGGASVAFIYGGSYDRYAIVEWLLNTWYGVSIESCRRGTASLETISEALDDLMKREVYLFDGEQTKEDILKYIEEDEIDVLFLIHAEKIEDEDNKLSHSSVKLRVEESVTFLEKLRWLVKRKNLLLVSSVALEYDGETDEVTKEALKEYEGLEDAADVVIAPFVPKDQPHESTEPAVIRILKSTIGPEEDVMVKRNWKLRSFMDCDE